MLKSSISKIFHRKPFHAVPVSTSGTDYEVYFEQSGTSVPIHKKHSLVALKPLLIAINREVARAAKGKIILKYKGKPLGSLDVEQTSEVHDGNCQVGIYKVKRFRNKVVNPAKMLLNSFYLLMQNWSDPRYKNMILPVHSQHQMHVYYMQPRPVVLITAGNTDEFDIFPMDNIGYVTENTFLLGLRKTSPSLQKLDTGQNLCISFVPYERRADAYALGTHHINGVIHSHHLSFDLIPSHLFSLPVPEFSLDVIEGTITHRQLFGSHVLLNVSVKNKYFQHNGPVLAHTPWFMKHLQTLS